MGILEGKEFMIQFRFGVRHRWSTGTGSADDFSNHFLFMSARGAAEKMGILESKGLVVWFRWEYSIGGLTCTADDFQATFYPSSLLKKILGRM